MPAAVGTVVGGSGNGCNWTKDGLVDVGNVIASFCFPFCSSIGKAESRSMSLGGQSAENVGQS